MSRIYTDERRTPSHIQSPEYAFITPKTDAMHGISGLGHTSLGLYLSTPESLAGKAMLLLKNARSISANSASQVWFYRASPEVFHVR
ncbi:hypothetical protein NKDENANG_01402 [Candidatus Entotheonellaceae bacterium PAL068K]